MVRHRDHADTPGRDSVDQTVWIPLGAAETVMVIDSRRCLRMHGSVPHCRFNRPLKPVGCERAASQVPAECLVIFGRGARMK